jgi:hypothetical protein
MLTPAPRTGLIFLILPKSAGSARNTSACAYNVFSFAFSFESRNHHPALFLFIPDKTLPGEHGSPLLALKHPYRLILDLENFAQFSRDIQREPGYFPHFYRKLKKKYKNT